MKKSKNKIQKTVNQTIVVDWLEVSFEFELPTISKLNENRIIHINKDCYIYITDYVNKYFETIANLYINNELIGEVKYNPSTPFIKSNTVHFKFENYLLYTNYYIYYIKYIVSIGFKINHIVRLDIAIDLITQIDLMKFIESTKNANKITTKGKPKNIQINATGKQNKTIYFGSLKSNKYIKIYNKSKELNVSNKNYITEFWRLNNLDYTSKDIQRIEITLKGKNAKNIDVMALNSGDYIASICVLEFKNFFEFHKWEKRHGKAKQVNITPVNFKNYSTYKLEKYKHQSKFTNHTAKIVAKNLYFNKLNLFCELEQNKSTDNLPLWLELNEKRQSILNQYDYYIEQNELKQYIGKKEKFWLYEFEQKKGKSLKKLVAEYNLME